MPAMEATLTIAPLPTATRLRSFFFSSRRRHTRFDCDWSSDVCSSDLSQRTLDNLTPAFTLARGPSVAPIPLTADAGLGQGVFGVTRDLGSGYVQQWKIGRASCRERV